MTPCLVDVNVLLALLVLHHEHHQAALRWFDGLAAREVVLCRFVQLGVIRLLGNRAIMREYALSAANAWTILTELLEDERLDFAAEPLGIDISLPKLLSYPVPTTKLVSDAYLAAFCIAGQLRLATFDQGFTQFEGLKLQLIAP